jgi:hypothetical protein
MKLLKMGNYLFKGFHIFMDKFFTTIPLADQLYKCGPFLTGTIRTNRKYVPKALLEKFNIGQKKFFQRGLILAAAYREKSQKGPVLLLTIHSSTDNRSKPKHIEKSEVIMSHNDYIGGIDISDMMLYCYLDECNCKILGEHNIQYFWQNGSKFIKTKKT